MSLVGTEAAADAEGAEAATGLGAGIEMGALGAAEGGLMTATEATGAFAAAQGGLDPFADAAFVGTAVATGLATGAGAIIGAVNSSNKEKKRREQEKELENERRIQAAIIDARKKRVQEKLNDLQQFIDKTPDIGKDIDTRLEYLYSHKKPYLNDPHFKQISDPTHYKIAPRNWRIEQEQIRYIHENLNIYKDYQKTVEGFPDDTLWLDKKRLGAEPGYQNTKSDTFWLDKKRLGVTNENVNLNENVPVETA